MSNPFQEQFLKAGLVTKQQVKQANQKKRKKQPQGKKQASVNETRLKAQQAAEKKAQRDRELNQKKQLQAQLKAVSLEIDQLITSNCLARDESCEIPYNFEHQGKIRRLYVNPEMKQKIIQGKLGLARIQGRYELVPLSIAEKIKQRNEKRVVILEQEQQNPDQNDPYADYQVPDDLMW